MVQPHPQLGGGAGGVVIMNQEMQSKRVWSWAHLQLIKSKSTVWIQRNSGGHFLESSFQTMFFFFNRFLLHFPEEKILRLEQLRFSTFMLWKDPKNNVERFALRRRKTQWDQEEKSLLEMFTGFQKEKASKLSHFIRLCKRNSVK